AVLGADDVLVRVRVVGPYLGAADVQADTRLEIAATERRNVVSRSAGERDDGPPDVRVAPESWLLGAQLCADAALRLEARRGQTRPAALIIAVVTDGEEATQTGHVRVESPAVGRNRLGYALRQRESRQIPPADAEAHEAAAAARRERLLRMRRRRVAALTVHRAGGRERGGPGLAPAGRAHLDATAKHVR